jgi:SAM-dependent methyltransferase
MRAATPAKRGAAIRLMYIAEKARNVLRGLLQAYGIKSIKRSLWNFEYSRGRWDCLLTTVGDVVYGYIEKYANKGSTLDLGCGSGNTGNELDPTAYGDYTGVDISDVAIEIARRRTGENGRADKNKYLEADISDYVPTQQFNVILFRESLYYVPRARIKGMLDRYSQYLRESGVFIVRIWNVSADSKTIEIVDTIESGFEVVEKYLSVQSNTGVIVFRRRNMLGL